MDSGEALKQVLDKFTNELAMVEAELNLVQEQIGELETRLTSCASKQQVVTQDRQKVISMLERYVHPGSQTNSQPISDRQPRANQFHSQELPVPQMETPPAAPTPPAAESPTLEPPAQAPSQDEAQAAGNEWGAEPAPEMDKDTVKSFNDAMRGLFNKK
ncbi:MAG: hypothetical protein K2W82_01810 [Candidatus Obscuribacterales bacterium]|nr:hypothetical protein [Candidatus Obscuribacterales bacterium]